MRDALTPDALAARVTALGVPAGAPLALAVSGGPDSLALLWLGAQAFATRATVLSVDHGLRAQAGAECAMVAACAAEVGLAHGTLRLAQPPGRANMQAEARAARYAAMAGWCRQAGVPFLLTAHHADDQAETLLLRAARGSGVAGLAGVRARTELAGLSVLRPLLGWRRADLAAVLAATGWRAAEDPANSDPRHDRTHARSLLAATPWLAADRLAASAAHLAEAEEALAWAADRAWAGRAIAEGGGWRLDPEGLPAELQRRLLLKGLGEMGAEAADGPAVARLLLRLAAGGSGTLGGVQARALADGRWQLRPAPGRR